MNAPLTTMLLPVLNHLLAQEDGARAKLAAQAGKAVRLDAGAVVLTLAASADGYLQAAADDAAPAVTIRVKLADLPLLLQDRERAFSYVTIEGDAELANTVSQVARMVKWDAEADLARIVGDIAAVRLVAGAKDAVAGMQATHKAVSENLAEYLTEEKPVLVRPPLVEDFRADVTRLRDDVERLAKRLEKLEKR